MSTWTVVGNGTAVRIFTSNAEEDFSEIRTLTNPANRLHEGELQSDRYGRSENSSGRAESYEEPGSRKHERDQFAEQVAELLARAYHNKDFENLYLMCSPTFLGSLRKHLSPVVVSTVRQEIRKNLVTHSDADIRQHLPDQL
jgi:protein required for attachment to host cells